MDPSQLIFVTESISEKGKPILIYDDYKFYFHKSFAGGEERWTCAGSKCKSFLRTSNTLPRVINLEKCSIIHNHSPMDTVSLQKQSLVTGVKRKALDDLCEKPSKLIYRRP